MLELLAQGEIDRRSKCLQRVLRPLPRSSYNPISKLFNFQIFLQDMISWLRFRRFFKRASDPAAQFELDVTACTNDLGRILPGFAKRYSLQVFTIALSLHLKSSLALCVREGHLTSSQTKRLIEPLLESAGEQVSATAETSGTSAEDKDARD
jgi:hypothetical protein